MASIEIVGQNSTVRARQVVLPATQEPFRGHKEVGKKVAYLLQEHPQGVELNGGHTLRDELESQSLGPAEPAVGECSRSAGVPDAPVDDFRD